MKQTKTFVLSALTLTTIFLSQFSTAAIVLLEDRRSYSDVDFDNQTFNTITPDSPFSDFNVGGGGRYYYNSTVSETLFTAEGNSIYTREPYFGVVFSTDTDVLLDFNASFTSYDGFANPSIAVNLVNVDTTETYSVFYESWGCYEPFECYASATPPPSCQTPDATLDSSISLSSGEYLVELIIDSDSSGPGAYSFEEFDFSVGVSAVPVPSSLILLLSGIAGLFGFRAKR